MREWCDGHQECCTPLGDIPMTRRAGLPAAVLDQVVIQTLGGKLDVRPVRVWTEELGFEDRPLYHPWRQAVVVIPGNRRWHYSPEREAPPHPPKHEHFQILCFFASMRPSRERRCKTQTLSYNMSKQDV